MRTCILHDFGKEVRVAGMLVRSGDIVHADRHGAVTIPEAVAAKIPAACDLLARKEAVILEMARAPGLQRRQAARGAGQAGRDPLTVKGVRPLARTEDTQRDARS